MAEMMVQKWLNSSAEIDVRQSLGGERMVMEKVKRSEKGQSMKTNLPADKGVESRRKKSPKEEEY